MSTPIGVGTGFGQDYRFGGLVFGEDGKPLNVFQILGKDSERVAQMRKLGKNALMGLSPEERKYQQAWHTAIDKPGIADYAFDVAKVVIPQLGTLDSLADIANNEMGNNANEFPEPTPGASSPTVPGATATGIYVRNSGRPLRKYERTAETTFSPMRGGPNVKVTKATITAPPRATPMAPPASIPAAAPKRALPISQSSPKQNPNPGLSSVRKTVAKRPTGVARY